MGGGGGGNTQTIQKADPWAPSQPFLEYGLDQTRALYDAGGLTPTPYDGQRVVGFNPAQQQGLNMLTAQASGPQPVINGATRNSALALNAANPVTLSAAQAATQGTQALSDSFANPMGAATQTGDIAAQRYAQSQQALGDYGAGLQGARDAVLDQVIPEATAALSSSGMLDSSLGADFLTRSASSALAPIEYNALEQERNRQTGLLSQANQEAFTREQEALGRGVTLADQIMTQGQRAAVAAPQTAQLGQIPGQNLFNAGLQQQTMDQRALDSQIGAYYEAANQPYADLERYSALTLGYGGQGGTSTSNSSGGGTSTGQSVIGGGLAGAGLGFAVGGPIGAAVGGIGGGLLGLF